MIFMCLENSKSSNLHRLRFDLTDKIDLQRGDKHIALSGISIYFIWKNKRSYENNKLKISGTT